jgi:hypothetical protein
MPKVLLGIPHGGIVRGKLLSTIVASLVRAPCSIVMVERESALGPDNRNVLAQLAIDNDFTHLWLVDNDMTFPPDTLSRLLAHDKAVVGAAYHYRNLPLRTTVKLLNEEGAVYIPESIPETLFACYAIGSGCKLVTTDALKIIPKPWFWLRHDEDGRMITTDDVWFCEQAAAVGIDTWCDPTIDARHIGDFHY